LLKTGMAGGPISQESFLRLTLGNPSAEREAKLRDTALTPAMLEPAFDASHGVPTPGGKPPGAGKPPGKNDKS
jgi:hypothetical protein